MIIICNVIVIWFLFKEMIYARWVYKKNNSDRDQIDSLSGSIEMEDSIKRAYELKQNNFIWSIDSFLYHMVFPKLDCLVDPALGCLFLCSILMRRGFNFCGSGIQFN